MCAVSHFCGVGYLCHFSLQLWACRLPGYSAPAAAGPRAPGRGLDLLEEAAPLTDLSDLAEAG